MNTMAKAAFVAAALLALASCKSDCEKRGGRVAKSNCHTRETCETYYVMVGTIMIPSMICSPYDECTETCSMGHK